MDSVLNALYILAVFPLAVWVYGNLSCLVQLIFNKNYNEEKMKTKYQLNSYASFFLVVVGFINFFNAVLFQINVIDICITVGIVIGSFWYLGMLFKEHILLKTT